VNRLAFLDQSRFQQQGAEFTDRLMPVNATHFLTEAHLLVLTQVGREVSPYALTQVDAFPHVQKRVVVAVEQVHPGGFGQIVEQGRIEMGRQAGALELLTDGLGQSLFAAIPFQQAPELPKQVGIGQGAAAVAGRQMG
jgi:hypothetical protein